MATKTNQRPKSSPPQKTYTERLKTHGNPNIIHGVGGSSGQRGDTLHRIPINPENEKKRKAS